MTATTLGTIRATISGFCLIAIGLCFTRWAYTPLVPSMIDAGWVDKPEAGYLGAFNSVGYMIGCIAAILGPKVLAVRGLMRAALLLAVVSLGMGVWDLGLAWLAVARFIAGFAGAICIIQTPTVMLKHISEGARGMCGGIAFAGAGIMIVVTSLLLPMSLDGGPSGGWLLEAGLTFVMAVIGWPLISTADQSPDRSRVKVEPLDARRRRVLAMISIAYVLAAIGVTPHTLFLADYLHRDLGVSIAESSSLFAILGAGCAIGSLTSGAAARFLGIRTKLIISYVVGAISVAMVLLFDSVIVVTGSAFLMGLFVLQCVPLTSMRTLEIVGIKRHAHFWGFMAISFGGGLAVGSYGMSGLLALGFEYLDLFVVAEIALLLGLGLIGVAWIDRTHTSRVEAEA
ncbi:MAG: YbfB/YjiJ family MFS transporter [Planctomycetota bacterium]|nr:YbfB/YjiJ family MFS transporter [Planctomycetota bacterium]